MPPERESPALAGLSRREREIMEVIYAAGRATAAQVHERIPSPPSATAVRTLLRILEEKGHLKHVKDGTRHVYLPTTPRAAAQKSALRDLLRTFFGGSRKAAVAALLEMDGQDLSPAEREEIARMIREAEARGE